MIRKVMFPTVRILLECQHCDHSETVEVARPALLAWQRRTGNIQDIFPKLTPEQRELMLSRTCTKCFDRIVLGVTW